jgi:dihydroxy-acid dehydratase
MPAGKYLAEKFHWAGGVGAVAYELLKAEKLHRDVMTVSGRTLAECYGESQSSDVEVIRTYESPLLSEGGFAVLSGNLFESAVMKISAISTEFRRRYLENSEDPGAFEGKAIVFEGPEDYHHRINDPSLSIDDSCILFIRGVGPIGYPGAAEVVNMMPPAEMIKRGVSLLPCVGDGRQSGTSASPSILNASPEAAIGGGLAIVQTGDRVRFDITRRRADMLVSDEEIARRRRQWKSPEFVNQTPWQELHRLTLDSCRTGHALSSQLNTNASLRPTASRVTITDALMSPRPSR